MGAMDARGVTDDEFVALILSLNDLAETGEELGEQRAPPVVPREGDVGALEGVCALRVAADVQFPPEPNRETEL